MNISPPPPKLDGADVLLWALSEDGLFHTIPHEAVSKEVDVFSVVAMAICQYAGADRYYLFKCDKSWEVVFDWDAASVAEAQQIATAHVGARVIDWHSKLDGVGE